MVGRDPLQQFSTAWPRTGQTSDTGAGLVVRAQEGRGRVSCLPSESKPRSTWVHGGSRPEHGRRARASPRAEGAGQSGHLYSRRVLSGKLISKGLPGTALAGRVF